MAAALPRSFLWEWKDPNDLFFLWKPFGIEINEKLEASRSSDQLRYQIGECNYIAHLCRTPMIQINENTKYKREIRRRDGNFDFERILMQWQWVNDDRHWIDYDSNINDVLTAAASRSTTRIIAFRIGDVGYEVDLAENRQINKATKYKREIRSIPVYKRDYCWEYLDDEGTYVPYVSGAQDDLEEAYRNGTALFELEIFQRAYLFDLKDMVQTRKLFGTKRKIRRVDHCVAEASAVSRLPRALSSCDSALSTMLTRLSLNDYAERFAREQISVSDVHLLSEGDLEKMGIPMGHRKRLLSAFGEARMEDSIPNEFYCPITMEVMKDPVLAADGFSYERTAIEMWLQSHSLSPMTNEHLPNKTVTPNRQLKKIIEDRMGSH